MSLTNSIRIPLSWPNVDAFTFGRSALYGYDKLNHCLIVNSPLNPNSLNDISNSILRFTSSPSRSIRRLILNSDETVVALISDKIAYIVQFPQTNDENNSAKSPTKESNFCSVIRAVPPSNALASSLIDFVWLTKYHFIIVYSSPSASQCYLYDHRRKTKTGCEYFHSFSIGLAPPSKCGTPSRKISLHQPLDIIKLGVSERRQNDSVKRQVFAMKTDGDIFLLEIDENKLLSSENKIDNEFQGPIKMYPSKYDNYGTGVSHSTFACLSNVTYSVFIYTYDNCQLNQSIILSPKPNEYCLYTVDLLSLSKSQNQLNVTSIVKDRFDPNRYFIADSSANVYKIEISWLNQIESGSKTLDPTSVQQLVDGYNSKMLIQQIDAVEIDQNQQYLAVISQSKETQQHELILIPIQSNVPKESNSSYEFGELNFVEYIRSLARREQSIPYVTLSKSEIVISNSDFGKNLSEFIKIINEQYIQKQAKIRQELELKQKYLLNALQEQSKKYENLSMKFQEIRKRMQIITKEYEEEHSRRQILSTHFDDLLSIVEQNTPILSDSEKRMEQQLQTYNTQLNFLKDKLGLIQQFITDNPNTQQSDNLSMENIQNILQNHQQQANRMKSQLKTISNI